MIAIKEVEEKPVWEGFNLASLNPTFLQSWAWGEFQKALGRQIHRLGVYKNKKLVGISLLIEEKARIASFLYVPAGPVFSQWNKKILDSWLIFVEEIAKEKNLTFLRADPRKIEKEQEKLLKEAGFIPAAVHTQPACTGLIDLTVSELELRHNLSASTRYNLNAAERRKIVVREGSEQEIETFLRFLKETAQRKALVLPREKDYHRRQFEVLSKEGLMKLFIAEYENQPLSAALVVFYGDTAYYLHAASSDQFPKLRASYPLVWFSILEGKRKGLKKFDFWGVAENDDPKHPWAGVTSFKLSFGAERECYAPPYDLPYQRGSYHLVRIVETLRKPLRKIARLGGLR